MDTLTPEQIDAALARLEGWTRDGDAIRKRYTFDSFNDAIGFINRVAAKAEAANHHPDLANSYDTVDVSLSTHSAGGVTGKDLDLAAEIEGVC